MKAVPATVITPEEAAVPEPLIAEGAPLSARALAVFVDYLLINALISLTGHLTESADDGLLLAMLLSALYYTIGNSALLGGSTIGKRLFGLRVCSIKGPQVRLLTLSESIIRYLSCFGAILLLAEIPERIFRAYAVVSTPYLLEAPMLLALVYLIGNACSVMLQPKRRGFHDFLAGSIVVRGKLQSIADTRTLLTPPCVSLLPKLLRAPSTPLFLGLAIGSSLWIAGLLHPPEVQQIAANRFYIEHEFPVRIISLNSRPGALEIFLLPPLASSSNQSPRETVERLGKFLIDQRIISADEVAQIAFGLYNESMPDNSAKPGIEEILFDTKSKSLVPPIA